MLTFNGVHWIGADSTGAAEHGPTNLSITNSRIKHRPQYLTVDIAETLALDDVEKLGIKSGMQLLAIAGTQTGFDTVAASLRLSADQLQRWLNVCDLLRVIRLTLPMAYILIGLEVRSVNELARQNPAQLYQRIQVLNMRSAPDRARVGMRLCNIWVTSANSLKPVSYVGDYRAAAPVIPAASPAPIKIDHPFDFVL